MRKSIKVQVLDKIAALKTEHRRVRFRSDTIYEVRHNGMVVRVSPLKPWNSKSERREVIRRRRAEREAAAA